MSTVTVTYLTPLLEVTGKRTDTMPIEDGLVLREVLNTLSENYGSKFKKLVSGENPYIVFMVNGRAIHEYGLETKIKGGDSILMGILVGGG